MKKLLPFIIAIFAVGRVAGQAIPNGGFENWNTSNNWMDPAGYFTSNEQVIFKAGGTPNVTQLPSWDGNHGFAVQLETEAINGDTMPAYITNSANNPLAGIGGVPYSEMPTGLLLWYNYSPTTGDTAGMIVVFKKAGIIIGAYLLPITVPATLYPEKQFTFSPALTMTPDTVIFAATSSINILSGKNGFAGTTFAISEVEFTYATTGTPQPTDLNWDFDPWIGDTAFVPTGWMDLFPESFRTKDANSGTYALELQTQPDPNNNGAPTQGAATTGRFDNTSIVGVSGGQPYTNAPLVDTMDFYYKYTEANGVDSGFIEEDFVKNDSIILDLGAALPPSNSYQHLIFVDNIARQPDSVIITFYSSFYFNPPMGSNGNVLKVDDISFRSQTSGIPLLLDNNKILIYPNPATTQFTISSAAAVINEVRLTNILGQTILDKQYSTGISALKENIDVSNLPSGMYFISISSGDKISTGKITVNR